MKMINPVARWALILLAIIAPLLYAWYVHYQRNNFTCESHLTIVDDDSVVDSIMTFTFHNGSGTYDSTGEYSQSGHSPLPISNKIAFKYWREEGSVIMVSSDTNELPKKDEPFRQFIPDFFHQRDNGIRVEIVPVNAASYLFSFGNSPAFYCSKS